MPMVWMPEEGEVYAPDEIMVGQEGVVPEGVFPEYASEEQPLEVIGWDDYGAPIMGVRRVARRRRPRPPGRRIPGLSAGRARMLARGMGAMQGRAAAARMQIARRPPIMPSIEGAPPVSEKRQICPFTSYTFEQGGLTSVILTASPQANFQGGRLITREKANTEAEGDGVFVLLQEFKIGTRSEYVADGDVPFDTFDRTAFGVGLRLDGCGPGITIKLRLSLTAALTTLNGTITVAATLLGPSIQ